MTLTKTSNRFLYEQDPPVELRMLLPSLGKQDAYWSMLGGDRLFLSHARYAIYQGLTALRLSRKSEILVPAYHCAAAIEPILRYGASVNFYRVKPNLDPDLEDIEKRINDRVRAVLCIHYFGFPQPIRELKRLCKERGLRLIEDCAHVISGTVDGLRLGSYGDISVFSLRKFFPTRDGGLLVLNDVPDGATARLKEPGAIESIKIAKRLIEAGLRNSQGSGAQWLGHRLERIRKPRDRRTQPGHQGSAVAQDQTMDKDSARFELRESATKMSRLSRWMLGRQDIEKTIERRRENYLTLTRELADCSPVHIRFADLADDLCPLACPVLIKTKEDSHLHLRARGVPATTWGKVIHPALTRGEFPEADALYRDLVFLPIHQGLGDRQIRLTARLVREVAESR